MWDRFHFPWQLQWMEQWIQLNSWKVWEKYTAMQLLINLIYCIMTALIQVALYWKARNQNGAKMAHNPFLSLEGTVQCQPVGLYPQPASRLKTRSRQQLAAYNVFFPSSNFETPIPHKKCRGPATFNPMLRLQSEFRWEAELVMLLCNVMCGHALLADLRHAVPSFCNLDCRMDCNSSYTSTI